VVRKVEKGRREKGKLKIISSVVTGDQARFGASKRPEATRGARKRKI